MTTVPSLERDTTTSSRVRYTVTDRLLFTRWGLTYRLAKVELDPQGKLSVWMVQQTKAGNDYKRNGWTWSTDLQLWDSEDTSLVKLVESALAQAKPLTNRVARWPR